MGEKGDKLSNTSTETHDVLLISIGKIAGVTSKKMFGGYGIFFDNKMFGMVDSKGQCFMKIPENELQTFLLLGSFKHGKMPYYSVPDKVFENEDELLKWTEIVINSLA